MKGKLLLAAPEEVREAKEAKTDFRKVSTNQESRAQRQAAAAAASAGRQPQKIETFKRQQSKVKRNDPCPCGSGKKFKQCHGK